MLAWCKKGGNGDIRVRGVSHVGHGRPFVNLVRVEFLEPLLFLSISSICTIAETLAYLGIGDSDLDSLTSDRVAFTIKLIISIGRGERIGHTLSMTSSA